MTLSTERNRNMISGAIGIVILLALVTIGIKASFGAFDGGYKIQGSFAAAGQGLIAGSDVKVRGVNVGEVSKIELVENRALVTMRIDDGRQIPVEASAVIRPKTLFGEKFVDVIPGDAELSGPYLGETAADGCPTDLPCIAETLGGFELERVLADTFPILQAIDPAELAVVLDELANSGDGLGTTINRSIVNAAALNELAASNDAEFRQFTADLALLSEELDVLAPELLRGARDLNVALPSLNARADQLDEALVQLGRLSGDLADVLENNTDFTENALTNGSKTLRLAPHPWRWVTNGCRSREVIAAARRYTSIVFDHTTWNEDVADDDLEVMVITCDDPLAALQELNAASRPKEQVSPTSFSFWFSGHSRWRDQQQQCPCRRRSWRRIFRGTG